MKRGDVYSFTSGPDRHRHIVISNPATSSDEVVVVNLTSQKPGSDPTCVLDARDYEWVGVIFYLMARLEKNDELDSWVVYGKIKKERRMRPELMDRITAGFGISLDSPQACMDKLKVLGGKLP